MLAKLIRWLSGIKIGQSSEGNQSIQIGHVTGNITIQTGTHDSDLNDEQIHVKSLVKQCHWPSVRKFMDAHFDTRIVEQLDKHQLFRLRRYAEVSIQNSAIKKGR